MKHEDFFCIDHRASPGLTQADLDAAGVKGPAVGPGQIFEAAALTCRHCGAHVVLNPERFRERGHCFKCSADPAKGYICDACTLVYAADKICRNRARAADHILEQAYRADVGHSPLPELPWNVPNSGEV